MTAPGGRPAALWAGLARSRRTALVVLALAALVAAVSRHAGFMLPRHPQTPVLVMGVVIGLVLAVRLGARLREQRERDQLAHLRAEAARTLPELLAVWIDAGADSDSPEADELRHVLVRRHEAIVAAMQALDGGREPEREATLLAKTTPLERGTHRGVGLIGALVSLQREALVEIGRRGWLAPERAVRIEHLLTTLTTVPPSPARLPGLGGVCHVATATYAALLPLGHAQRILYVALAAGVGLALVALDALADRRA